MEALVRPFSVANRAYYYVETYDEASYLHNTFRQAEYGKTVNT